MKGENKLSTKANEIDFRLIRELQNDSRQKHTALAKKLGLSESTVRRRIARLARKNMVRFTVFLIPESLGFLVSANIGCNVKPSKIDEVADQIASLDIFYSVSIVAGRYDIMASGYFKSVDHVYEVIRKEIVAIKGIERVETLIILKRKKRAY